MIIYTIITILFNGVVFMQGYSQHNIKSIIIDNPQMDVQKTFVMPQIPVVLNTPSQRAEFLVTHYWSNFDFTDTTLINRADITEQAFVDFVNILPNTSSAIIKKGVQNMITLASGNDSMFNHFYELSEKYLYEPNSPFFCYDLYITVLECIIVNNNIDEVCKIRPRYQLGMALKNRVGEKAADFSYVTESSGKSRLNNTVGRLLLLFFFRPDCHVCTQVKEYVKKNGIEKQVKILFINTQLNTELETLYDLRASPTLYLLDKNKTVILKDTPIEDIENYLKKNLYGKH